MIEEDPTPRKVAMQILEQPRDDIHEFHQYIAPWIKRLVKQIRKESIGYQNNAKGEATHLILECAVEWWDETRDTVWLSWDVNTPTCYEDHFDFLFEKPRIDTPLQA